MWKGLYAIYSRKIRNPQNGNVYSRNGELIVLCYFTLIQIMNC